MSFRILATGLVATIVFCTLPAWAINRSWDDGGPDKNWSTANNWTGNLVPASNDDVLIGDLAAAQFDIVLLDINDAIASLTITNAADLRTSGFNLLVNGPTILDETVANVVLRVDAGAGGAFGDDFDTDSLTVLNGAQVLMQGGILEVDLGELSIDGTSFLAGFGTIDLEQATAGQVLDMSGTLTTSSNGPLTINAPNGGTIDLDGDNELGVVRIQSGASTLNITAPLADSFSGSMFIGGGNNDTLNITNSWGANGTFDLTGGEITGGSFSLAGNFDARSGDTTISSSTFNASIGADIDVGEGILTSTLTVTNNANFFSGSDVAINALGTLQLDGTATFDANANLQLTASSAHLIVNGNTTINQATFNWDGPANSTTTIGSSGDLTINSTNIDLGGQRRF